MLLRMSLPQLLQKLRGQTFADDDNARPLVTLEEFFVGNEDPGSIGCNLVPHPGVAEFFRVLRGIRERADVEDVLVGVSEDMGDDTWPFSDCVYVITSAAASDVESWVETLGPEPVVADDPEPPANLSTSRPGYRVITVWWD